jgi:hemoglobin-like flavoprotein
MDLQESLALVLEAPDCQVCEQFYHELFAARPHLKVFFEDTNLRHQAAILTMSMQVVVEYDRRQFRATRDYLKVLGHKHHTQKIPREEFGPFRDALLKTLAQFHGAAWSAELEANWRRAIDRASEAMLAGYVDGALFY